MSNLSNEIAQKRYVEGCMCSCIYTYIFTYNELLIIYIWAKDVPRAWNCHMWVKDSFLRRCVLEMHYFHVLWVCSCKALWELRTSPLLYSVKTLMVATATLPSARRRYHQIALALVKTALVQTARSPCERHAGVSSFGLGYSEMFEWIKGSSQDCSRHVLPQKFNLCFLCRAKANLVNPSREWTRTNRTISFARAFTWRHIFI